ncbi:MAG: response regulator [Thermodesulfobacteriota bacterium]
MENEALSLRIPNSPEGTADQVYSLPDVQKPGTWKVLIVDDEEEVHRLTRMALDDFSFEGRNLTILSALSAQDAETILRNNPDISLILLDVIMETDDAGLKLVRDIREKMKNNIVQIVLRTGQPGLTPQKEAVSEYEINGYTSKIELTAEKMFSTVTASLRAYWLSYSLQRLNLKLREELLERKRAEEAVRRLTQFQEAVIDNASIWLDVKDTMDRVIIWNKAAEQISGYSRQEVLGQDQVFQWLYPEPEKRESVRSHIETLLQSENPTDDYETTIQRKDGQPRTVSWAFREIKHTSDRSVVRISLGRDVTEHRQLESQLRQSQKMEAVGRMAGGLAHDFNNLLTVIRGYCDIAISRLNPKDQVYGKIKQIEKAASRAEALTRQLLAFSRHQVMTLRPVNLNTLIRDMIKMLARLLGSDIDLRISLDEHLGNIKADYGQIEQVIMNLVVNARDAMPDGGTLILETRNLNTPPQPVPQNESWTGDTILLSIGDTGCGMDVDTLEHIFEPFFTTKEKGKGTGLGLSTVYGIVNQSKGRIEVNSEKDKGTRFDIYFPGISGKIPHRESREEIPDQLHGTETILIVEDQPDVLKLTSETLHMYGYKVLEAPNAGIALLICEEYREKIDLLLADVVMPQMNGVQLVKRLWKMLPSLKVLFMSGYTYNIIEQQGLLEPGQNFIQKPFTAQDLLQFVRRALDIPLNKGRRKVDG